eukprot:gene32063-38774_t
MFTQLDQITAKIGATEADIEATKAVLAEAKENQRTEEYLTSLQNTLVALLNTLAKQQEEKNILLTHSVPKSGPKRSWWSSWFQPEEAVQHEDSGRDYRPKTPDFKRFVYGFVGLWESDELSVHGTACAISQTLVFTAYHNIKDHEIKDCALVRELLGDREVLKADIIQLDLIAFNEDEDWALLSRKSGRFVDFCNTLCDERQLPAVGSYVAVFDFPVGLITATADGSMKLSCDSLLTSVYQYEGPSKKVAKAKKNSWKLVDQRAKPLDVERVISVKGGRSIGSCGAPCFTLRGFIIGFHTVSVNNRDDGSNSHTSYSCANVFCRLPHFVAEYKARTGLKL